MIKEVRTAFKDNVNSISWMDKFTKMAVMDKVFPPKRNHEDRAGKNSAAPFGVYTTRHENLSDL